MVSLDKHWRFVHCLTCLFYYFDSIGKSAIGLLYYLVTIEFTILR